MAHSKPKEVRTLTVKECEKLQHRAVNGYGDKWPFKGFFATGNMYHHGPLPNIPEGWQWVHVATWGMHVRRDDDIDCSKDL